MATDPATPTPRLILRVQSGKQCHDAHVIATGGFAAIGRAGDNDFVLAKHTDIDERHFTINWQDRIASIQANPGGQPVSWRGEPVMGAILPDGADFMAGLTSFQIFQESLEEAVLTDPFERSLGQAIQSTGPWFALVDAARTPRIRELLNESVDEHDSLFEGDPARSLDDVAPYLVRLEPASRLLPRLIAECWGAACGIYLRSTASFADLRRHLRRCLRSTVAGDPRRMFFRLYDPRSLREVWPILEPAQQAAILGPIERIWCENGADAPPLELTAPAVTPAKLPQRLAPAQWQVLEGNARNKFAAGLANTFRESDLLWSDGSSSQALSDHALTMRVTEAVHSGARLGLSTERELAQYVLLRAAWTLPMSVDSVYQQMRVEHHSAARTLVSVMRWARAEKIPFVDVFDLDDEPTVETEPMMEHSHG